MKTTVCLLVSLFITTYALNAQAFKTVKAGNATWMAENLKIPAQESWYYNDKPEYGEKYGRLYTWEVAKNVCPSGWHLPTIEEWDGLIKFAGGNDVAGKFLKRGGSLGFNAIFGGMTSIGNFMLIDTYGGYWSSSGYDSDHAWYIYITPKDDLVTKTYFTKKYGLSVRCVKNN
jgi:uncharacterized protein (TIGR02145 family)